MYTLISILFINVEIAIRFPKNISQNSIDEITKNSRILLILLCTVYVYWQLDIVHVLLIPIISIIVAILIRKTVKLLNNAEFWWMIALKNIWESNVKNVHLLLAQEEAKKWNMKLVNPLKIVITFNGSVRYSSVFRIG